MYFQAVEGESQTKALFEDLFSKAKNEVVAFSRPPYCWRAGEVNSTVLEALARGVKVRALYPASLEQDDDERARLAEFEAYVRAGVEGRVLEEVPIKMVVFDREVSLVSMPERNGHTGGYPPNFVVDHDGFSALQADGFERNWAKGRSFTSGMTLGVEGDIEQTGQ